MTAAPEAIDAEILSEEKIPERPREVRSISLPQSAAKAARGVAESAERFGLPETAAKLRTVAVVGDAVHATIEAAKPGYEAVKDFGSKLKDMGLVKMGKRPPMGPRKVVK